MNETYQDSQLRMIHEARRRQEAADAAFGGWIQGYEAGKAEQAERDVSKRWHGYIFAFVIGAICAFVAAGVLTVVFWRF